MKFIYQLIALCLLLFPVYSFADVDQSYNPSYAQPAASGTPTDANAQAAPTAPTVPTPPTQAPPAPNMPHIVHAPNLGSVANTLMEPVTILANFIASCAIVLGISFLFAAFFKYMQYRVNPLAVPISTVVLLVVMGVCLLLIPFLYKLSGTGFAITI